MKPGTLNLPTIWRGCSYSAVRVNWTDTAGRPINITGWKPRAYTRDFQFTTRVIDGPGGITAISLPQQATQQLALGVRSWDFIWSKDDFPQTISTPYLRGNVEVKQPVTDPLTHVAGRIGGGSNYVRMFDNRLPDGNHPVIHLIGRYHQSWPFQFEPPPIHPPPSPIPVAPTAREQMAVMNGNSQRALSMVFWFKPAIASTDPIGHTKEEIEWVEHHYTFPYFPGPPPPAGTYPSNVSLSPQQQVNLIDFLEDVKAAGFDQLNVRFDPVGKARPTEWEIWRPDRYAHNRNYILSIIQLIELHKGDLKVIYDLGIEWASRHLLEKIPELPDEDTTIHRLYCRRLWAAYVNIYGPNDSMAFSIIGDRNHNSPGQRYSRGYAAMLLLFKSHGLPFPGYYGFDVYGDDYLPAYLYNNLIDNHDFTKKKYPGEALKPVILQESFYNDSSAARQISLALGAREQLNLYSIFQWVRIRNTPGFPDIFPQNYFNYQTL